MKNETTFPKVMIVEDEKDLCLMLSYILKKQNLLPCCVNTLRDATMQIKRIKPEILFLDNHLPDGLGSDYIQQLKKICPRAKVIMMTAHDSPKDINKAFTTGADYFISKPFNKETIHRMLSRIGLSQVG
ncbi:MAG: response regulator [Ginsengibacter sp.]